MKPQKINVIYDNGSTWYLNLNEINKKSQFSKLELTRKYNLYLKEENIQQIRLIKPKFCIALFLLLSTTKRSVIYFSILKFLNSERSLILESKI